MRHNDLFRHEALRRYSDPDTVAVVLAVPRWRLGLVLLGTSAALAGLAWLCFAVPFPRHTSWPAQVRFRPERQGAAWTIGARIPQQERARLLLAARLEFFSGDPRVGSAGVCLEPRSIEEVSGGNAHSGDALLAPCPGTDVSRLRPDDTGRIRATAYSPLLHLGRYVRRARPGS